MLVWYLFLSLLPFIPIYGMAYYLNKMGDCYFRIKAIKRDAERKYFPGLSAADEEDIATLKKEQWKYGGISIAMAALSALLTFMILPM